MSTKAAENLNSSLSDGLLTIELNRPDALNAWIEALGEELLEAIRTASEDPAVRAVMITGAGRAFSSGADLKQERKLTPEGVADLSTLLREVYNPVMLAIQDAPKPVIAAVNGPAAGIGAALAFVCDLIVAAESAYFLLAFVNVGLIPDGGSTYTLASRVGYGRAAQLAMLGQRLPASLALEWGIVNAVFPDEGFAQAAAEFAAKLAAGPTVALANMKRALRAGASEALAGQLELEATLQQEQASTLDYAEGVAAFKEKRRPRFTGR
jgi:2-(1,2-epoxy-1,2-dihydrophenyl)acetyl-CoA isomerase